MKPAPKHVWADIDPATPNPARVYDALLGGRDNYSADREFVQELLTRYPMAETLARSNRYLLTRTVSYLVSEADIEQFIDIGSGLPTVENVHEVAHRTNPAARIVYVDNDPLVLAHGRALLAGQGPTTMIEADLREPAAIINHPGTRRLIDFSRPIALILCSVLHFVPGSEAAAITRYWRDTLTPGSHLVISHAEDRPELAGAAELYQRRMNTGTPRTHEQITDLFDGFELVKPGLVPLPLWRPDTSILPEGAEQLPMLAGVGRLPAMAMNKEAGRRGREIPPGLTGDKGRPAPRRRSHTRLH